MFKRIWWEFEDLAWKLKRNVQRFIRGYADSDSYDISSWFIEMLEPMLRRLQATNKGYPERYGDEGWTKRLGEMADCLHYMDEKNVIGEPEKFSKALTEDGCHLSWSDYEEIRDIVLKNRDKFFEMFKEDFYDLWD